MNIEQLYSLYTHSYVVTTDTRKITPKSIYFAFKGKHFNGNVFAQEAIKKGALAAIVEEKEYTNPSNNIFWVEDTLQTIQELAQYHREQLNIPIIGLTGSNGKTTTKELMAAVLQQQFKTLYTQGNLNNHLGVPLTLLSILPSHEIAIIEMGANHQKEIELLCNLAQPTIGYITNFGKAHLEGFGGIEGVIKGKSELYNYLLKNKATALINENDEIQLQKSKAFTNTITFGKETSHYHFSLLETTQNNTIHIQYKDVQIHSNLTGNYNFSNLSAAISLGLHFNIPIKKIQKGIEEYIPENNRSQVIQKNNKTIVMDAYNANPSSMEVALYNFSTYKGSKTVILGDMFELGKYSDKEHQKIIQLAAYLGFDQCFFVGENFYQEQTTEANFYREKTALQEYLSTTPISTQNILIKGSRGMALESLIEVV